MSRMRQSRKGGEREGRFPEDFLEDETPRTVTSQSREIPTPHTRACVIVVVLPMFSSKFILTKPLSIDTVAQAGSRWTDVLCIYIWDRDAEIA